MFIEQHPTALDIAIAKGILFTRAAVLGSANHHATTHGQQPHSNVMMNGLLLTSVKQIIGKKENQARKMRQKKKCKTLVF